VSLSCLLSILPLRTPAYIDRLSTLQVLIAARRRLQFSPLLEHLLVSPGCFLFCNNTMLPFDSYVTELPAEGGAA